MSEKVDNLSLKYFITLENKILHHYQGHVKTKQNLQKPAERGSHCPTQHNLSINKGQCAKTTKA